MPKSFVFMNHHIKQPASDYPEPVITIQTGRRRIHCNEVQILGGALVREGRCPSVRTHQVKAWIECSRFKVIK